MRFRERRPRRPFDAATAGTIGTQTADGRMQAHGGELVGSPAYRDRFTPFAGAMDERKMRTAIEVKNEPITPNCLLYGLNFRRGSVAG
jgi:hypothetical protein